MFLRITFEKLYPEGVTGGQCAKFAHKLIDFPLVGDFLSQKIAAVKKHGILKEKIVEFKPGDVIVTDESKKYGHVAVINNVWNGYLGLTESNFNLDEKVHHTRRLKTSSPAIIGIIRGSFKFTPIFVHMNVKVFANVDWNAATHFSEANTKLKAWSGVQAVFDIVQTRFTDIPMETIGGVEVTSLNWYREHITKHATGYDMTILLLPYEQWNGANQGVMLWADPGQPVRILISGQQFEHIGDMEAVTKRVLHEIAHAFAFLTGDPDTVHYYDFERNNLPGFFQTINYQLLAEKLGKGKKMDFYQIEGESTLVHKIGSKYFPLATDPVFYPYLKDKYGWPSDFPQVTKAEVESNLGGTMQVGLTTVFK
jgi:hypothetical protein